jgi:hypothetical protein
LTSLRRASRCAAAAWTTLRNRSIDGSAKSLSLWGPGPPLYSANVRRSSDGLGGQAALVTLLALRQRAQT